MNFYADYVHNKLNAAISSMSSQIEDYVKNPGMILPEIER